MVTMFFLKHSLIGSCTIDLKYSKGVFENVKLSFDFITSKTLGDLENLVLLFYKNQINILYERGLEHQKGFFKEDLKGDDFDAFKNRTDSFRNKIHQYGRFGDKIFMNEELLNKDKNALDDSEASILDFYNYIMNIVKEKFPDLNFNPPAESRQSRNFPQESQWWKRGNQLWQHVRENYLKYIAGVGVGLATLLYYRSRR
jgi:hypothetical protein